MMPRDAIIVSQMRAGSTFLVSALSSHPDVKAYDGEVCYPGSPWMKEGDSNVDALRRYYKVSHEDTSTVGKITYAQFDSEVINWVATKKMPVIHLTRENYFLWANSAFQDQATSDPRYNHFFEGMEKPEPPRYEYPPQKWFAWMQHCEHVQKTNRAIIQGLGVDVFEVTYERITQGGQRVNRLYGSVAKGICSFLGVLYYQSLPTARRKSAQWSLKEVITNWQEVHNYISRTRFKEMMEGKF